ncbi:MAG: bifunctional [glutamate--ammonia ligase]-adenylyl-L-tyrosine phosphorylase/[glutamate--ammonia-ligase] adenylyltransferase, partial [Lentisphaeria bacterium]
GRAAMRVVNEAAYERATPAAAAAAEIDRLRGRVLRELARERPGRHDVKFGRGALAELQLTVGLLQLVHGHDQRVRTTRTERAIAALGASGVLAAEQTQTLQQAHELLRRLEQRMRVVHGDDTHLLQQGAPGLGPLARRMGLRGRPAHEAAAELVRSYRDTTERVHRCYQQIVGSLLPVSTLGRGNGA